MHFGQLGSSSKKEKKNPFIIKKGLNLRFARGLQNSWANSGLKHSDGAKKVVLLSPQKGVTLPALQTYILFGYQQRKII
jgi:hypothetical protein